MKKTIIRDEAFPVYDLVDPPGFENCGVTEFTEAEIKWYDNVTAEYATLQEFLGDKWREQQAALEKE